MLKTWSFFIASFTVLLIKCGQWEVECCPYLISLEANTSIPNEDVEAMLRIKHMSQKEAPAGRGLQMINTSTPTSATPTAVNNAIKKAKADIIAILQKNQTWAPRFVRLIFHDCVGSRCDGCVLMTDPHNFGLGPAMALLESSILSKYKTWLSRGDVWALAALTAAETAQAKDGTQIPFNLDGYGRISCNDTFVKGPPNRIVGPQLSNLQLLRFFKQEFEFTTRQVVAIMGGHALGKAHKENSGFDGDHWVLTPSTLDNNYYRAMTEQKIGESIRTARADYVLTAQTNPANSSFPTKQFFWTRFFSFCNCSDFLFNADLALVLNLKGFMSGNTGKVTCALRGSANPKNLTICPEAPATLSIVNEYANNGTLWKNDFQQALLQMSDHGYQTTTDCGQPICPLVLR